ncbi:MAG TPA: prohibitin family protein [Polyangia bacterium]|nr:prohibitin family protein [Polyangia bacterium]
MTSSRALGRGWTTLAAAVVAILAGANGCATVGPGQVGVLWQASGGTQAETYGEGIHAIAPWNDLSVYDLRSMSHDEVLDVIAVNGLGIKLDASVRYHLNPNEFYAKILEPVLRSEARRVFGRYTPEEIYSTKREIVEREIREGLATKIEGKHIVLEAILIRDVQLPEAIRRAIDQKLAAEQEVLKMKYVLEVSKAAADEKRIDAQGVADYNHTIAASLSPPILEFERIQQLNKLAASSNAKTVVIGERGSGAPVLLSTPTGAR